MVFDKMMRTRRRTMKMAMAMMMVDIKSKVL